MNPYIKTLFKLMSLSTTTNKKKLLLFNKCLSQLNFDIYRPFMGLAPCAVVYPYYIGVRKGIKQLGSGHNLEGPDKLLVELNQYDVEENIGHLMTLARMALEKGEVDKAVAILEMGIKVCEEYQSYIIMPYMYDILAAIFMATGKLSKAEELLVEIIEKMIQLDVPENDTQIVDFKLRLARIYSANNDDTLAEIGFKNCLNDQETKIQNGDTTSKTGLLYVNVLFWYGLHRIKQDDFLTAKSLIDNAYSYSQKIKGLSPYQEMIILTTLSDLNAQLEEYELALQNMFSAILLGKSIGSLELPKCYLKLGKIYKSMGSEESAGKWVKEAYDLALLFGDAVVVEDAEQVLDKLKIQEKK